METGGSGDERSTSCPCCGGTEYGQDPVLWRGLVEEWGLSPFEAAYIDRQQGHKCVSCGSNLRSRALASAILAWLGFVGTLDELVGTLRNLRVLEVNQAGDLTQFLGRVDGHVLVTFPEVDMQALPFADRSFDLVVHSDTLEHVPDPVAGLAECRRVLAVPGATCFTVPIVVDRMTRTRAGLPPSYHSGSETPDHVLVRTEFGADVWRDVLAAGFGECRIHSIEYPAGLSITAVKLV
jgi:SAM-dependent methyltransferase